MDTCPDSQTAVNRVEQEGKNLSTARDYDVHSDYG